MIIGGNKSEYRFTWKIRENVSAQHETDLHREKHITERYASTTDEIEQYMLKNDLVEHVWNRQGLLYKTSKFVCSDEDE